MVEAGVTVEQAGDALYTAFRIAQESLDAAKVDLGDAQLRPMFMQAFRTFAVDLARADGALSPAERLAIDQIFWLDHADAEAISNQLADHPEQAETAIQYLCAIAQHASQADDLLGRSSDAGANKILAAADLVGRAVLAAGAGDARDNQQFAGVMARLRQAAPAKPVVAPPPPPAPAPATSQEVEVSAPAPADDVSGQASLTPVSCPARLRDEENCYAVSHAVLSQESNVVRQVRFGGISARVKIVRGLSYRAGSYNVDRTRAPKVERIADGTLCITDQRLIFLSDVKNLDLPLAKLLSCSTEPRSIEITRSNSGRLIFEEASEFAVEVFEQLSGTSPAHRLALATVQASAARARPLWFLAKIAASVLIAALIWLLVRHYKLAMA